MGDRQLTALIERGLANAPSVAASTARIRQARARLTGTRAALMPTISGATGYVYADLPSGALGSNSGSGDLFSLGFDAQWELDLWGGKRADTRRSAAQAQSIAAQADSIRVSLAAEIARTYVTLAARRATLDLLSARQELDSQLVAYGEQRFAAGTAPRQPLEQAKADLARTRGELAGLTAEGQGLQDMLALLVGETPQGLGPITTVGVPLPPDQVSIGDPAALLQRRPDIRVAERKLAAAKAQIGVERARRFPSISFLGLIGIGGSSAKDVFDPSQLTAIALPSLRWSFLDFGRSAAAIRAARAEADAALADYHDAVLTALQDAEAALARYGGARISFAQASEASQRLSTLAGLEDQRAAAGAVSRAQAIASQRRKLDAAIAEVNAEQI
jgi:NodT family efflux transporter outer membrane factor (OMF) lipoprotein